MKRLIVVYNPKSSHSNQIEAKVLAPARSQSGVMVGKYEVLPTGVENNVSRLKKLLSDGDLVLAAGGDATVLIALNGCLESGKKVIFAVLPFGNFNDTATSFGNLTFSEIINRFLANKTKTAYFLDVKIDKKHFRYAASYTTVGMMAEATQIFDKQQLRRKLHKKTAKFSSYFNLARWYLKNRKKTFLPKLGTTDYMAINGSSIGGIMRSKKWFLTQDFLWGEFALSGFFILSKFMFGAIFKGIKGKRVKSYQLDFEHPTTVAIQTEGEYVAKKCQHLEITKHPGLEIICR